MSIINAHALKYSFLSLAILSLMAVHISFAQDRNPKYYDKATALSLARQHGKGLLINVTAASCSNCITISEAIDSLPTNIQYAFPMREAVKEGFIYWYCRTDATEISSNSPCMKEIAPYIAQSKGASAGLGDDLTKGFALPLVMVVDPADPNHYFGRAVQGMGSAQSLYVDMLLPLAYSLAPLVPDNLREGTTLTKQDFDANGVFVVKGTARWAYLSLRLFTFRLNSSRLEDWQVRHADITECPGPRIGDGPAYYDKQCPNTWQIPLDRSKLLSGVNVLEIREGGYGLFATASRTFKLTFNYKP